MGGACVRPNTPEKVHTVHSLRTFKFRELLDATEHFGEDRVLGEGGFGTVYKGLILEHSHIRSPNKNDEKKKLPVAVKRLRRGSAQGIEQWVMEVRLLEKLQHPNLVRLLGYCAEGEQALLIYEYLPGGSLDALLFGPSREKNPLPWLKRIQIACNAAEGLCFLHENNIIHRDMKASNILLDENFQAKLTDFGLARSGPMGGDTHLSTRVVGTLGYCCPTYMQTGRITIKTDLYAFGVVLLELLTGRPNLGENGEDILADCLRPLLQAPKLDLEQLVDPRLGQEYSMKGANELALLASNCIEPQPRSRPETDQVVVILKRILKLGLS